MYGKISLFSNIYLLFILMAPWIEPSETTNKLVTYPNTKLHGWSPQFFYTH